MKRAISPFIATAILIAATLVVGGLLYTQFKQSVDYNLNQPSLNVLDARASEDGTMLVMTIKNDGAKEANLQRIDVYVNNLHYVFTDANSTFTPSQTISPGSTATVVLSASSPIFTAPSVHIVLTAEGYSRGLTIPVGL